MRRLRVLWANAVLCCYAYVSIWQPVLQGACGSTRRKERPRGVVGESAHFLGDPESVRAPPLSGRGVCPPPPFGRPPAHASGGQPMGRGRVIGTSHGVCRNIGQCPGMPRTYSWWQRPLSIPCVSASGNQHGHARQARALPVGHSTATGNVRNTEQHATTNGNLDRNNSL